MSLYQPQPQRLSRARLLAARGLTASAADGLFTVAGLLLRIGGGH